MMINTTNSTERRIFLTAVRWSAVVLTKLAIAVWKSVFRSSWRLTSFVRSVFSFSRWRTAFFWRSTSSRWRFGQVAVLPPEREPHEDRERGENRVSRHRNGTPFRDVMIA